MEKFLCVSDVINTINPSEPIYVIRKRPIARAVKNFLTYFKGKVLYAVKTNPFPEVLKTIYENGIKTFDVASLQEIQLVRSLFSDAELYFMHPVKNRQVISEAYHTYNVKSFSLDCETELEKIVTSTNSASDLNLFIRLSIPNIYAEIDLSGKFGAIAKDAVRLLQQSRKYANKLGICFHVGSQCMNPDSYRLALIHALNIINESGVQIDVIDVGGGFPSVYPGMQPPPLNSYFDTINNEIQRHEIFKNCEVLAEPGRALVAESGSVLVRVELRKNNCLYINDGTYGALFDAGTPGFIFPTKLIRKSRSKNFINYRFYGPTCDGIDIMEGPFCLPDDIKEGDFIEIGQLGAYSISMRTQFNGFYSENIVEVTDEALIFTLTKKNHISKNTKIKIAA